jgi:hypothetical protein
MSQLKSLDISRLWGSGGIVLFSMRPTVGPSLERIVLIANVLGNDSRQVPQSCGRLPQLRLLDLSGCQVESNFDELVELTGLCSLILRHEDPAPLQVSTLLQGLSQRTFLSLDNFGPRLEVARHVQAPDGSWATTSFRTYFLNFAIVYSSFFFLLQQGDNVAPGVCQRPPGPRRH